MSATASMPEGANKVTLFDFGKNRLGNSLPDESLKCNDINHILQARMDVLEGVAEQYKQQILDANKRVKELEVIVERQSEAILTMNDKIFKQQDECKVKDKLIESQREAIANLNKITSELRRSGNKIVIGGNITGWKGKDINEIIALKDGNFKWIEHRAITDFDGNIVNYETKGHKVLRKNIEALWQIICTKEKEQVWSAKEFRPLLVQKHGLPYDPETLNGRRSVNMRYYYYPIKILQCWGVVKYNSEGDSKRVSDDMIPSSIENAIKSQLEGKKEFITNLPQEEWDNINATAFLIGENKKKARKRKIKKIG